MLNFISLLPPLRAGSAYCAGIVSLAHIWKQLICSTNFIFTSQLNYLKWSEDDDNHSSSNWICPGSQRQKLLDWRKCLQIIEGIAHGLLYLHKYSRLKIIRRDLKASNISVRYEAGPKNSRLWNGSNLWKKWFSSKYKENSRHLVSSYAPATKPVSCKWNIKLLNKH